MNLRSYGNGHHSHEGEVKKSEMHENEEPKKLDCYPFEWDHGIDQKGINYRLKKCVCMGDDSLVYHLCVVLIKIF